MRRVHAVALAAVVALAGCPATTSPTGTVTPAPVPESATPAGTVPCDVPRPSSSSATATPTRADPVPIPVQDRIVNTSALIDRHDRVLRNSSYRLSGPDLAVQADPEAPAFRVRAQSPLLTVRHYVVDGTRYTFYDGPGGQRPYQVHEYDVSGIPANFGSFYSMTGSSWLAQALSIAPHRFSGRYPHGGVVLRAEGNVSADSDGTPGNDVQSIESLESTVTVDRRGIVRAVEQHYEVHEDGNVVRIVNHSFAVRDVGKTTVSRPQWVCDADRHGFFEDG